LEVTGFWAPLATVDSAMSPSSPVKLGYTEGHWFFTFFQF